MLSTLCKCKKDKSLSLIIFTNSKFIFIKDKDCNFPYSLIYPNIYFTISLISSD